MSNVLLWFPRVAFDNCTVNGKLNLIFKEKKVSKLLMHENLHITMPKFPVTQTPITDLCNIMPNLIAECRNNDRSSYQSVFVIPYPSACFSVRSWQVLK